MRMIDEDEVGVKEHPEDTRYIKKITLKQDPKHRKCGQRNLIPTFAVILVIGTADSAKCRCVQREGTQWGCEMSWPGGAYNRLITSSIDMACATTK